MAVEAEPGNAALRLHLAGLLLESGTAREALDQAATVLSGQPDNLEALRLASKAAEAAGETERARSYMRLLNALMGQSAKSLVEDAFADAEPPPPPDFPEEGTRPQPSGTDVGGGEWFLFAQFSRNWAKVKP